jgi:hypothetical protein
VLPSPLLTLGVCLSERKEQSETVSD